MLMVGIPGPSVDQETLDLLNEVKPLAVILFARNTPDLESTVALTTELRERYPELLLAIDHEGGRVQRLGPPFTHLPAALEMARCGDPELLRMAGRLHAGELRAAGFDIDFAPVLDVHTNPANPVIGDRAFGTTPEEVIHFALPYMQGLAEAGILGCAKHFPGHGDTSVDSHLALPRLGRETHSRGRLRELEMRPFARAIAQGAPMMMTAHIVVEAYDDQLPATMSPTLIDGCLRDELGYNGFVVSDDLEMKAIADEWGVGPGAVAAIGAGCDACLVCLTTPAVLEAHQSLVLALENGTIERGAVARIAKRRDKLLKRARRMKGFPRDLTCVGHEDHRALQARFV